MGLPEQLAKRISEDLSSTICSLASVIYLIRAFFAAIPKGMALSLWASLQTIKLMERFTSLILKVINSVTRIPVAYKSSNMALSLISLGESPEGCSNSLTTSSVVSISGIFFSILGAFKRSEISFSISFSWLRK